MKKIEENKSIDREKEMSNDMKAISLFVSERLNSIISICIIIIINVTIQYDYIGGPSYEKAIFPIISLTISTAIQQINYMGEFISVRSCECELFSHINNKLHNNHNDENNVLRQIAIQRAQWKIWSGVVASMVNTSYNGFNVTKAYRFSSSDYIHIDIIIICFHILLTYTYTRGRGSLNAIVHTNNYIIIHMTKGGNRKACHRKKSHLIITNTNFQHSVDSVTGKFPFFFFLFNFLDGI